MPFRKGPMPAIVRLKTHVLPIGTGPTAPLAKRYAVHAATELARFHWGDNTVVVMEAGGCPEGGEVGKLNML